jgi:prepilin-type processing-associated H-X9-DG protein
MAVLLPALDKARQLASTTVCSANLKSYGHALQMYVQDNDNMTPFMVSWLYSQETLSNTGRGGCPKGCRWHYNEAEPDGSLWTYLENKNVHMCPTFKKYADKMSCPNPRHSNSISYEPTYSYSMNYFLGFDWSTGLKVGFEKAYEEEISMNIARVTLASNCFAFSEENLWPIHTAYGNDRNYSYNVLNDNTLWLAAQEYNCCDNFATYHNVSSKNKNNGFANAVFVDGHVETLKGKTENKAYLKFARPYPGHEDMNVW